MRKKGNIPRITCSSFSPDFGDLANFMEILQEIEVTSKHLVQENICVAPAEVESIEINNGADSPTKPSGPELTRFVFSPFFHTPRRPPRWPLMTHLMTQVSVKVFHVEFHEEK